MKTVLKTYEKATEKDTLEIESKTLLFSFSLLWQLWGFSQTIAHVNACVRQMHTWIMMCEAEVIIFFCDVFALHLPEIISNLSLKIYTYWCVFLGVFKIGGQRWHFFCFYCQQTHAVHLLILLNFLTLSVVLKPKPVFFHLLGTTLTVSSRQHNSKQEYTHKNLYWPQIWWSGETVSLLIFVLSKYLVT